MYLCMTLGIIFSVLIQLVFGGFRFCGLALKSSDIERIHTGMAQDDGSESFFVLVDSKFWLESQVDSEPRKFI